MFRTLFPKLLLLVITTVSVVGCATYSAVEPGPLTVAKGPMEVAPSQLLWNKASTTLAPDVNGEVWTAAGITLDQLMFISNLEDGETLFDAPQRSNQTYPTFSADMLPNELVDLVTSSLSIRASAATVDLESLSPRQFAGADGFDMTYSRTGPDEVLRRGRASGAVIDGKLHLIIYEAPRLHYFDQYLAEVEALINTARLVSLGLSPSQALSIVRHLS